MTSATTPGLVPQRTADPAEARAHVASTGAAILTGCGLGADAAQNAAEAVFGSEIVALPPAAPIRPGPATSARAADDGSERGMPHTDGFAYGNALPDHFLLLVDHQCAQGGANFLVDGWRVLDDFAASPVTAPLAKALSEVSVDQTETGMHESIAPIVLTGPDGSRMVRRPLEQRPRPDSSEPVIDAAVIGAWRAAVDEAAHRAPLVRVEAGEALVIDNRRVLHGRDAYVDQRRSLWRVWVWTDLSLAVPEGQLASDRRNAWIDQSAATEPTATNPKDI